MEALTGTRDKFCLIIAMQANFLDECLAQNYNGLAQKLEPHAVYASPLNTDELRAAICIQR